MLWKHSDYRPGGRTFGARSRRLVVSMCCTLANYGQSDHTISLHSDSLLSPPEYIWNYRFYQDGSVEFEVRLTGILQVYVKADGELNKYGTTVGKNVNAHYHQHLFSLRVDPMIDGLRNSVEETDVVAVEPDVGSPENFAGNAFVAESTTLNTSTARDYSFERDRRWRIVNPNSKPHYSTGAAPGYGIQIKGAAQKLLAKEKSWVNQRAAFASKTLWVVKDKEGDDGSRMWPAGKYVPQTREEPKESVGPWSRENAGVDNEDILLYLTLGK